jgi:hypothetical protein
MEKKKTKLTLDETTYEFNYFMGRNEVTGEIFDSYGVYVNGALNTDYVLKEATKSHGVCGDGEFYILFWKSFSTHITIKDFSLGEIVKVINYINKKL